MDFQSLVECGQRLSRRLLASGSRYVGLGRQLGKSGWRQLTSDGRHDQTKRLTISDAIEWSEVLRCKSVQDFVRQDGDLELNSPRDAQPVQTD